MQLGNQAILYMHYCQVYGVIHGVELHSQTMTDLDILDVVYGIASDIAPDVAPTPVTCRACLAGTQDKDQQGDTECEPCELGRFSDADGMTSCTGMCSPGSTILTTGASSQQGCTECEAGRYGPVESGDSIVCAMCGLGRNSAAVGAASVDTCQLCAPGTFSGLGSTECERSGCTDTAADNYDSEAVVDEGTCTFSQVFV
jgi:hypothetical protein